MFAQSGDCGRCKKAHTHAGWGDLGRTGSSPVSNPSAAVWAFSRPSFVRFTLRMGSVGGDHGRDAATEGRKSRL